jgi:autotransporter-associated beta strand protein
VREGGDGGLAKIDQQNPSIVYHQAPTASFGATNFFRKSTDGGVTWAAAINGMTTSDPQGFYAPFFVDPANGSHLFYGTNHLYESTNAAASWTMIGASGVNGWPSGNSTVGAIAMAPSAPGTIYAMVSGLIMSTTNDGGTWTTHNAPNSTAQLLVDPANSLVCYAVTSAFGGSHVLESIDGGTTFTNISGNLPDLPTYSIALNPAGNTIYVGNDNGVYASTDGGTTWNPYGFGMPNVQVRDLEYNSTLGVLAAITHGRGMYEISTALPTPIVVNTSVDETTSGDGLTSLREAIAQANVGGGTITFAASLFGGTISLTGGQLAISNGVVINGPNSRSLTISGGGGSPLEIAGGAAVTIADLVISGSGTVLQVDSTAQASLLDVTVGGNITDIGSLGFFQAINDTVSGSISGGGSLTKTGLQTLTLAGTNSYSGGTTVTTGTLAGTTGALRGGITVSYPGMLAFDQSGLAGATGSFSGAISGTGTVRVLGPASTVQMGTTNGSTPSTFTNSGPTVIDAGAAVIASATNDLSSTSLFIVDGTLNLGGFGQAIAALSGAAGGLVYNFSTQPVLTVALITGSNNGTSEFDGLLEDVPPASGNGGKLALQKVGTGTLTLARPAGAPNTYTGGTTITAGTLIGNTAAIEGSIADNAVLSFDQTLGSLGDGTFSGSVTGTGIFNVLTGIVRLAPGATLQNFGSSTITGTLVGPASGGTNALSNHSAYTINGTLDLGASDQAIASLSGGGTVYHFRPGGQPVLATLTVGGDNSSAVFTGIVEDTAPASGNSGILAVTKLGSGVFTLTGANTFTGGLNVLAGTLGVGPAATTVDPLGGGTVTLNGGNLSLNGRLTGATQQIVAATGYNQDVIAEAAAANAVAGTGTTFDGNYVWYEMGFVGSGTSGLPTNGSVFASAFNPAVSFQLQPYTSNNVALIPGGNGSVTLTLSTPAAYTTLNLLAAAANGAANLSATLNFADSTSATAQITVSDWFNGSQAAFTANGRIIRSTTATVSLATGNPRLYEYDYTVPTVDQAKQLTSITFNQTSGNQVGIFGLSGAASVVAAAQSYANAVQVLSTDTIDVENSPTAGLGSLTIGAGGVAQLQQNASSFVVNVNSLSISSGGKLDLKNNTMFVNYGAGADPIATLRADLANGYNGGGWNGTPTVSTAVITSSTAASGPANTFAVGYADSADGFVAGQPANSIEIRYTVMGDTNLDRVVNSVDAIQMARNYLIAGRTAWDLGNFNYDSTINLSDATILQKNFNATATGSAVAGLNSAATSSIAPARTGVIHATATDVATPAQPPVEVQGTAVGSSSIDLTNADSMATSHHSKRQQRAGGKKRR